MSADLRDYLDRLAKIGELAVVKKKVSTKYEIAAVTAKLDGSKAVMFENIKESKFRVVSNLVGTKKRFAIAVGATEAKIHDKVSHAINHATRPKTVQKARFMENSSKNLYDLPIITHFEKEPGAFITSSIV